MALKILCHIFKCFFYPLKINKLFRLYKFTLIKEASSILTEKVTAIFWASMA